jgi:hypothetical protein
MSRLVDPFGHHEARGSKTQNAQCTTHNPPYTYVSGCLSLARALWAGMAEW